MMRGRFFKGGLFNKIIGGTGVDLEHLPENSSIYLEVQDFAGIRQTSIHVIVKSAQRIDGVPEGFLIEGIIDKMGPTTEKVVVVYCPVSQSGWIVRPQQ